MFFRSALAEAMAVLSPVRCAGCGKDDHALCPACAATLDARHAITQHHTTPGGLDVVSAVEYRDEPRLVILALKEQGRTDAAGPLAAALARAVLAAAASAAGDVHLAVPPAGRGSRRRRGFDPVPLLLSRAGLPPPVGVLRRVRSTLTQKSLDREGRMLNSGGAMLATRPLDGVGFILVDDVLTTGSTLDEAHRAISAAGGTVVGGAVLAFTPLRQASRGVRESSRAGDPQGFGWETSTSLPGSGDARGQGD